MALGRNAGPVPESVESCREEESGFSLTFCHPWRTFCVMLLQVALNRCSSDLPKLGAKSISVPPELPWLRYFVQQLVSCHVYHCKTLSVLWTKHPAEMGIGGYLKQVAMAGSDCRLSKTLAGQIIQAKEQLGCKADQDSITHSILISLSGWSVISSHHSKWPTADCTTRPHHPLLTGIYAIARTEWVTTPIKPRT